MNSSAANLPEAALQLGGLPALPLVEGRLPAGFPSPADDFQVRRLDLNDLIAHPLATFMWRVSGQSMVEAGIHDGDIVVVDRALRARHGSIVVAQVDGEHTIKYLHQRAGSVKLVPANPTFPEIRLKDGQQLQVVGVVTMAIKRFV